MASPKPNKRDSSIRVYLTAEEKEMVEQQANDLGTSVASYVRILVIADIGKRERDTKKKQPQ